MINFDAIYKEGMKPYDFQEKACKVFKKHFPEETCKIEEHTGVIYP